MSGMYARKRPKNIQHFFTIVLNNHTECIYASCKKIYYRTLYRPPLPFIIQATIVFNPASVTGGEIREIQKKIFFMISDDDE